MALAIITPNDATAQTRDKLNAAISSLNSTAALVSAITQQITGKASASDFAAVAAALAGKASTQDVQLVRGGIAGSSVRPGDGRLSYTLAATLADLAGPAEAQPILPPANVAITASGQVARIFGGGILASRSRVAVEPGRSYIVRAAVRREANPADPNNHAVALGMAWLDQAYNLLPSENFVSYSTLPALTVASGRQERRCVMARASGARISVVAPAGAVYAVAIVRTYGEDGVTNVESLGISDVTDQALPSEVSTDVSGRVAALESQAVGSRLGAIEAQLGNPQTQTFRTRPDAASATIPAAITAVVILGGAVAGDRPTALYKRVATIPAGADGFTSQDGGRWLRVYGDAADFFGSNDVNFNNRINLNNNFFRALQASGATATDGALVNAIRVADYVGGTPGRVNFALRAYTQVAPDAKTYEWAFTSIIDNSATQGENVAGYFQAIKRNTGGTWGLVVEATEPSGTPYGQQIVGMENVLTADAGDASNSRIVHYAGMKATPGGLMNGYAVYLARGAAEARALYVFSSEHTFREAMFYAKTSIGVPGGVEQRVRWFDFNTTTPGADRFRLQHRRIRPGSEALSSDVAVELRRDVDGTLTNLLSFETMATRLRAGNFLVSLSGVDGSFVPNLNSNSDLGLANTRWRRGYFDRVNVFSGASVPTGRNDPEGEVGEIRYFGGLSEYVKTSSGWAVRPAATLMPV